MLERFQDEILSDLNALGAYNRIRPFNGDPIEISAYVMESGSSSQPASDQAEDEDGSEGGQQQPANPQISPASGDEESRSRSDSESEVIPGPSTSQMTSSGLTSDYDSGISDTEAFPGLCSNSSASSSAASEADLEELLHHEIKLEDIKEEEVDHDHEMELVGVNLADVVTDTPSLTHSAAESFEPQPEDVVNELLHIDDQVILQEMPKIMLKFCEIVIFVNVSRLEMCLQCSKPGNGHNNFRHESP